MNIPIELLASFMLSYFNILDSFAILPFIVNKHQRIYITFLKSKVNTIIKFMKKVYRIYNTKLYNIKLANLLIHDSHTFLEIIDSSDTFHEYIREILGMLIYKFPQYTNLFYDFYHHKPRRTMKNITRIRTIIGPTIHQWHNEIEQFKFNTYSRVHTPVNIHRIYPVKLHLVVKILKSNTLKALLF
tara:strand:+ start:853 stop:1410 length:558 start_codon:yes stop_codon:yes gene_type:complete